MQMRQRDVARAKYTKELADAKAENDALRDDVAAGRRRRLHIKAVCQSVREATASGVDNAASRLADTAERNCHPQREADHYAKTTGRANILMSSADRVAHIDGQLICEQYTRFQRV